MLVLYKDKFNFYYNIIYVLLLGSKGLVLLLDDPLSNKGFFLKIIGSSG